MALHTEKAFEAAIEDNLLGTGDYARGDPKAFDPALALTPSLILAFLKDTQPEAWAKLEAVHGSAVEKNVIGYIAKQLDQRGTLDVLRHGVTDHGIKLHLAFFRPASGLNEEALRLYDRNILTVTRQVHYSPRNPDLSIDLLLSLNGLPVATAELKNPFTGQTAAHAMAQYKARDEREPLLRFKTRALVHFAVDADEVFMTTRLAGQDTAFLPFNKGRGTGKGNPDNPQGYKTAYLWEEVWAKDRWLDILARTMHLQVQERLRAGKRERRESLIFPRYHQLDAVAKLVDHARRHGPGQNYLIEHSAGSGKSNTIGWLAHRLANLHDDEDRPVFSSVIVITDRRVLDRQLQDTIYQFEHKAGVVEKITGERAAKSNELEAALRAGRRIIISTIQTFSFVALDRLAADRARRFAIIVDEAHSSQSGETATSLKRVLQAASLDAAEAADASAAGEADEIEDAILKAIRARGRQPNMSFFAFTATPKKKTLELFGQPGPDGKPRPFHLYAMRQAIEEGFILDVLRHYMTYKTYFRLSKAVEDDPEVDKDKARRAIARFASLHPHNLAQKTEVMVEHFRRFTRHRIGGRAKAMVVTRSRLHAVRYKQAFDHYLKRQGYTDMKALVAFSGTVIDPDTQDEFTEPGMNGFGERELPERFETDAYQVLIVAEKYQTGFDQPLLHTMFVDKKLDGLRAVQTLSRLNRICPGKEDSFVLDFANEAEEIREAFKPYYEQTEIDAPTDPNQLHALKLKLDAFQFYWRQEVEAFAKVFFKPVEKQRASDQGLLHKAIDPAVTRFTEEPDEARREEFRSSLHAFVRLYGFLAQVIPYADPDLEKLYVFARLLRTKLPKREGGGGFDLDDEVALAYYRLDKTFEGSVALAPGEGLPVTGLAEIGTSKPKEEKRTPLSEVIEVLNQRFGTDFREEDRLFMDQVVGDLARDERLREQARANPIDNFKHAFDPKAMEAFLHRLERNGELTSRFMSDREFRELVLAAMAREFYERARGDAPPHQ